MSIDTPPPRPEPGGCLTALIRIPVRIVVMVLVVPARMVWDALASGARLLDRAVLRPVGRSLVAAGTWLGRALFVWPWVTLWRYVLGPLLRYGIAVPAGWLYRAVLTPMGHGLRWLFTTAGRGLGWFFRRLGHGLAVAAVWLGKALFVWPWVGLWRYVVVPVCRYGIAVPVAWLWRRVLTPLGTALVWLVEKLLLVPLGALFAYVVVPLFRYGVVVPARWLDRYVLTPAGHGLGWFFRHLGHGLAVALVWLGKALFVWPWVALWRYVVVPVCRYGIAVPVVWLWRRVLTPLGREVRDAFAVGWRVAGFVSRAVGRAFAWLVRNLVGRPLTWVYRTACAPVGRWVRDSLWAPARRAAIEAGHAARDAFAAARATVRQARKDAWRALAGGTR